MSATGITCIKTSFTTRISRKHGEEYLFSESTNMGNFIKCVTKQFHRLGANFVCCCVPSLSAFKPTPAVAAPAPAPAVSVKFQGLTKTGKMKVKWTQVGLVFFLVLSLVMTGCFLWQYQLPKLLPGKTELLVTGGGPHCVRCFLFRRKRSRQPGSLQILLPSWTF